MSSTNNEEPDVRDKNSIKNSGSGSINISGVVGDNGRVTHHHYSAGDGTPPVDAAGEPIADATYSPHVKIKFCRHLGVSWHEVADLLDVPLWERSKFGWGREPTGLWEWLERRGRLAELPGALRDAGRRDLADQMTGSSEHSG
jgi:hypothetical protein